MEWIFLISTIFQDRTLSELQTLARDLITYPDVIVMFITEHQEKLQLVCARSENTNINVNSVLKEVLSLINGKGGGKPFFVQGGGDRLLPPDQVMEELMRVLTHQVL